MPIKFWRPERLTCRGPRDSSCGRLSLPLRIWSAVGVTLGQNKIMRECEGVGQGEELFFKLRIGNFLEPTVIDRTYSRVDEVHVGLSLQVCAFEMGDWQS